MRKTKFTAIIMLIIASMLASIVPVWAATIDTAKLVDFKMTTSPSNDSYDYHPYIEGTKTSEWSIRTSSLGDYGRKSGKLYGKINFGDMADGKDFAAFGITFDTTNVDLTGCIDNAKVNIDVDAATDSTVATDNLYYAIMTRGTGDTINFAGKPVTSLESASLSVSDFEFVCSTGSDTAIDLSKVCGLGFVRLAYTGEGTAPTSEGRIYVGKLEVVGLNAIDDLQAEIMDNKPVISFTAPTLEGLTYAMEITGDDNSERSVTLTTQDFETEGTKYTWKDEAAEGEVTYTYKLILGYNGLTSESNTDSVTVPEDIGGDAAPDNAKSSVVSACTTWTGTDGYGTKRAGDGCHFTPWDTHAALGGSAFRINMGKNNHKNEAEALADTGNPSYVVDYFAAGRVADGIKGGPEGTNDRCVNIAAVADTGVAVFRAYIESGVDLDNSYFSIGQRYYTGSDIRLNFAGVPMSDYVDESDKEKAITVVIPLTDFNVDNEKSFHKVWHYNFDWEQGPPADRTNVDLRYFTFIGAIRDCSKGSTTQNEDEDIYISTMAICDVKPVTNFKVRESSPNKIILGWDHAETLTDYYNVYRDNNGDKELIGSTSLNRISDTQGFDVGDTVKYYIAAVNEYGVESPMEEVSLKIESIGKPDRFRVENVYSDTADLSVNISWNAPKYGDIDNYVLYRNGVAYQTLADDAVSFQDTSVEYGKEYSYYMQAVDTAGNMSIKTEEIAVIVAAVPTVENFRKTISGNDVTFTWNSAEYADKYELTVYGTPYEVAGTTKTVTVPYKKEITASIKAVNIAGAKSYVNEAPVFAIYDPADTYESVLFDDDIANKYKLESSFDADVEATNDKKIFGTSSLKCDFTKVSGKDLEATILASEWNVEPYRKNNAKLTFWINAENDVRYDCVEIAIQGPNEKISGNNVPTRTYVDLSKYVSEKGKWVYVEVPFADFPAESIAEYEGSKVDGIMNYTNVKGIAIIYDGAAVVKGGKFYIDDIKVKVNPLWTAPTLADDQGNAITNGGTISADAKAVVLTFAEAMDAATLTPENVWIEDAAGNVLNAFVTYENNKATINFAEQLAQSTQYTLHIVDVKSANGVTASVTGNDAVSFTSGTEAFTGELNALPVIEPVITSTRSGSTVTVTISMPQAPVYTVKDYNITLAYDKRVLTPNGATATTLKALTGATVSYGDGVITITGNAGETVLSGALTETIFGVSSSTNTNVTVSGTMEVKNTKADATYNQSLAKTATLAVQTGGAAVGGGGGGAGGGDKTPVGAGREDATIKGNEEINPTGGESTQTGSTFTDINSVPWAADAISALIKEGIISGYPDNTVKPEKTITREEFASLLVRTFSFKTETKESPFADVANDAWYAQAIIVAQEKGIVSGIDAENFGVGSTITREDMCTMIYRAMQASRMSAEEKYDSYQFADDEQISQYAKDAITALYKSGVISGVSDTEFAPKAEVNRAMAARVLYGILGMM